MAIPLRLFVEKQQITPSMTQICCFVSILFRVAQTADSALLLSHVGESQIESRWRATHGTRALKVERNKFRREAVVVTRAQEAKVPVPDPPVARSLPRNTRTIERVAPR